MSRPCMCDRCSLDPFQPYTLDQCRLCWLYHHDLDYRAHWGGAVGRGACTHLGRATGATVACPSCRGTVALKLFTCAVHGQCTQAKAVAGIACCATCPDFFTAEIAEKEIRENTLGEPPA
jgi:hypothetical protein